ncbi:hypothetical protein WMY93_004183 [Mugilogobius chulae]|uniref:Uncharacterized protein n=1 Tax=Mugilogobius chulae TaxID=88201 RepID=A0AAW0PN05_9GOBI
MSFVYIWERLGGKTRGMSRGWQARWLRAHAPSENTQTWFSPHLVQSTPGSSTWFGPPGSVHILVQCNTWFSPHLVQSTTGSVHTWFSPPGSVHTRFSPHLVQSTWFSPHLVQSTSGSVHTWFSPHLVQSTWFIPHLVQSTPGSVHLVQSTPGSVHLVQSTWFSLHLVQSTPGSVHTWFSPPGSVHTWFSPPGSVHLVQSTWSRAERQDTILARAVGEPRHDAPDRLAVTHRQKERKHKTSLTKFTLATPPELVEGQA